LKLPLAPVETQVGTVGLIKKVVCERVSASAPAAVTAFTAVSDTLGSTTVDAVVAVPAAVVATPSEQVAAPIAPFTVSWANALPVPKVKAATATSALERLFNWFFMVIAFKVKKGTF